MMNSLKLGALTAVILPAMAAVAAAQSSTQTFQYQVNAINVISLSAVPTLTISAAVPGSPPTPKASTGVFWAITTNQSNAKVTARINLAMPVGVTMTLVLEKPALVGVSAGVKTLTTTAQDMVTGLTKVAEGGLDATFTLTATSAAGVVSGSRTVTFTLTGGV